jgi:hypothetical protein
MLLEVGFHVAYKRTRNEFAPLRKTAGVTRSYRIFMRL